MGGTDPTVVVDDLHVVYRVYEDRIGGVKQALARRHRPRAREIRAVRGVSFTLFEGESVGIVGANGSGKSTLLSALTGLLPAERGSIRVRSRPTLLGVGAAMRPALSGRRNIFIGGLALGLSKREITEQADAIIAFAGIEDFIDLPMRTYSSGMRARLMFAIATSTIPDILMVDEALAVGDEAFRRRSQERIDSIRDQAGTVVLVSHNLEEMRASCDRALWLDRGVLVGEGPPGEVIDAYQASSRPKLRSADDGELTSRADGESRLARRESGQLSSRAEVGRLVMHIGSPLAGGREIQRQLGKRGEELGAMGLAMPDFLGRRNHFAFAAYAAPLAARRILRIGSDAEWQSWRSEFEAEFLDDVRLRGGDWLISSEHLVTWLQEPHLRRLGQLVEKAGFDEVEVVLYLRRQDDLAADTHAGWVAEGRAEPFDIVEHMMWRNRYDWDLIADRWVNADFVSSLNVRLFPDRHGMASVTQDFESVIGLPEGASTDAELDPALDGPGVEFLRRLNAWSRFEVVPPEPLGPLGSIPAALAGATTSDRYRLPAVDAVRLMSLYGPSNERALARVEANGRVDDYFADRSYGPEPAAAPTMEDAVRFAGAIWRHTRRTGR